MAGRERRPAAGRAGRGRPFVALLERQRIATLRRDGLGVRQIAAELGRSPSTISRELRRNTAAHDRSYDGDLAHARARERLRRPRAGRLLVDRQLRALVQAKLELEWSPEQIAGWLRIAFPRRPRWICHETIYQGLYLGGRRGLSRQLTRRLRTSRPLRRRRRRADQRRTRFVAPGRLIDQRPAIVLERERVGDWEGDDLIIGRSSRSAIATLVDRRSRYLQLVALPHGHHATAVRDALIAALGQLPPAARHTLTWDQGSELAHHKHIGEHLAQGVFFAYPASPWLRGTNENTNGLLRQYFPKGSDLSAHPAEHLRRVQDRLNNRPRKTLGWQTPTHVFNHALRSS